MQIGMIGLGRMGSNMVQRLMQGGHQCVVYDRYADAVNTLNREGATGATSLEDLIARMSKPRALWLMLPAMVVDGVLAELVPLLEAGDIVTTGTPAGVVHFMDPPRSLQPGDSVTVSVECIGELTNPILPRST